MINKEYRCFLCDINQDEDTKHFIVNCPVFYEFRKSSFSKTNLTQEELIQILKEKTEKNCVFLEKWLKIID